MTDAAIGIILQYGAIGVGIIVLAIAYAKKDKQLDGVNEKRVAEARESIKAIEQNTNTLETLTEVLRDRKSGK
jgi:hypothetical protein